MCMEFDAELHHYMVVPPKISPSCQHVHGNDAFHLTFHPTVHLLVGMCMEVDVELEQLEGCKVHQILLQRIDTRLQLLFRD